ncbi:MULTISPECIES: DsbA family protein [Actinopolyspora]|uniref:Protein-disulfide isomerase n=1 Tax=Actinopolyspora saharensis TaxID=995062 RepID=A0A1H1AL61_9ACTN|nr:MULTISPECIES: thioredoxin domain-containing protein [Actinopolyspora]NHD17034.1 thioredoxin domain-containing protein [Actinopolyspora sp. BKK2]NHE76186.1 thioredoxin domain-containing protein [Actinopolyspora sp. BKK1]SDQ40211.1 Protein-disulfide isomerase [Actinopolyspora saharensis]
MPKTTNPMAKRSGASTNIILTAIVLVVAVAVIGGVVFFGGGGTNSTNGSDKVAASVLHPEGSNKVLDAGEGAPTLVEFVDYQCPSCHSYYQAVNTKIEQEYDGKINFVVRNFPLDMHPLAEPAARAVEAAAMQGEFKQMYHKVFDNYSSWAAASGGQNVSSDKQRAQEQFTKFAEQIGLDVDKFQKDMQSDQVQQRIDQDRSDGEQAGVSGTPTYFLNGKKVEFGSGGNPVQHLREELDGALAK